jgi:hypothetical protein
MPVSGKTKDENDLIDAAKRARAFPRTLIQRRLKQTNLCVTTSDSSRRS